MTDAELAKIAEQIFVTRERTKTALIKPTLSGPAPFKTALDAIGAQHDFKDAGLAVIDFTRSEAFPDVWLRNADKSFRVGSASKIAMMLAAVQLRQDVRAILDLKIISTAAEFDALYANRKLWSKAKVPAGEMSDMAEIAASPPLISQIFDFTKKPVDFFGPDPDGQTTAAKQKLIMDKLLPGRELGWANWSGLQFSERYWLTGCLSDDVAAATCVSQIGVPYIKAVQRAYGLADPAHGMHLLATGTYAAIPGTKAAPTDVALPRPVIGLAPLSVEDEWSDGKGGFTDKRSVVPGSAAALAAYMIALKTDKLVPDFVIDLFTGQVGIKTLSNNLADGGAQAIESFLAQGVKGVPNTVIKKQLDKIGILGKALGAKAQIICEFVYLETRQVPKPPAPRREFMKYAVVAVGIISELDATPPGHSSSGKATLLGEAVHKALLTL